jgi:DNA-binding transcriptional ArsR family regulator
VNLWYNVIVTDVCEQIERFGKAIGNTTRYNIIQSLASGPKTVGEIAEAAGCSSSVASQHLKVLKLSDIVTFERSGQQVHYRLNAGHMLKFLKSLTDDFKERKKKA